MWHYDRAQTASIIKSINKYDWGRELEFLANDPNLLTEVLTNIFSNFIPNDGMFVKPSDPAWMSNNITHSYRTYKKHINISLKTDALLIVVSISSLQK